MEGDPPSTRRIIIGSFAIQADTAYIFCEASTRSQSKEEKAISGYDKVLGENILNTGSI